jgi:hypothetical protein
MSRNLHHANNASGAFIVSSVMLVIALAMDNSFPNGATTAVVWLLGLMAFASIGASLYFRFKNLGWDK